MITYKNVSSASRIHVAFVVCATLLAVLTLGAFALTAWSDPGFMRKDISTSINTDDNAMLKTYCGELCCTLAFVHAAGSCGKVELTILLVWLSACTHSTKSFPSFVEYAALVVHVGVVLQKHCTQ